MDQNQALTVLVQAVQIAQSKGAYSLQEAAAVSTAVSAFTPPAEVVEMPADVDDTASEEGDKDGD